LAVQKLKIWKNELRNKQNELLHLVIKITKHAKLAVFGKAKFCETASYRVVLRNNKTRFATSFKKYKTKRVLLETLLKGQPHRG
jgi:hypothetical protein